jgi:hypothetical protein
VARLVPEGLLGGAVSQVHRHVHGLVHRSAGE